MASLTAEITWLWWLLEDFGISVSAPTPLLSVSAPTPLLSDSTGAISIARDSMKHELTKYIGVDVSYMRSQVAKYSLAGFVVGYPFNLQGQASPDAVQVRLLVGELYKTGKLDDLSYTYWDENFTSKCVEALLDPLKLHDPVETKTMTDKFAAVCILQGYLDNMNRELRSADNSEE